MLELAWCVKVPPENIVKVLKFIRTTSLENPDSSSFPLSSKSVIGPVLEVIFPLFVNVLLILRIADGKVIEPLLLFVMVVLASVK